jgi:hypothetical protein
MTALADAIRSKTGLTDALSIAEMTVAVGNIQIGGGGDIDFTGVTVTADKLLEGIVAINATGSKVTGTIKSVTASVSGDNVIVPAGFHPEAKSFPVSGGGADVSAVTVTASDILKGKIAVGADGKQIIGTIETVSASRSGNTVTVPAGFHNEAKEFVFEETPINLSFVTATANDILAGKIGSDANGNPVNGAIQTVNLSVSDNVVTIAKGFTSGESVTIPEAPAPSVSGNVVTVNKGYQATEKKVTVGTARESTTITPSTSWKQIPSDTYLTGTQYIAGDENLIPENIAEGVSIFGVEGTHSGGGGGSMDFYKCVSVDREGKKWSGYKAVLNSGEYSFEESVTADLRFNAVVPKAGKIYTADALAVIEYLFDGLPSISVTLPLSGDYAGTVNGNSVNVSSGVNGSLRWGAFGEGLSDIAGEVPLVFDGESYLDLNGITTNALTGDFTLSLGTCLINPGKRQGILSTTEGCHIAIDVYNGKYNFWVGTGDYWDIQADWDDGSGAYGGGSIAFKNAMPVDLTITRKGKVWKLFVDGELAAYAEREINIQTGKTLRLGMFTPPYSDENFKALGRMQKFAIYPEAVDDNLVNSLRKIKDRLNDGTYAIYDAGTEVFWDSNGEPNNNYYTTKINDGWALAGIYEGINADGTLMRGPMLVSEDPYSCIMYRSSSGSTSATSFEYYGKTYYCSSSWTYHSVYNDHGHIHLDTFVNISSGAGKVEAATELLDRHFGRYTGPDLSDCNLYVTRAGIEGLNGKWVLNTTSGDNQGKYVKGTYHIGIRSYGGYYYMYDITDPDTPLYAACVWDDATGDYVPTEDVTGPWITMMAPNPPPKVLIGENGL